MIFCKIHIYNHYLSLDRKFLDLFFKGLSNLISDYNSSYYRLGSISCSIS